MAVLHGRAIFPGAENVVACTYTRSHGISPSIAELIITPQRNFTGEGGTLVMLDGVNRLTFPDCKVDRHSFEKNSAGLIWRLAILDRRWKWKFPTISGHYNLKDEKGNLIKLEDTKEKLEKTPQELATLCLEAMGERRFDVSQLPNDSRPTVTWDHDNAANALSSLCEELGCRIVLRADTDSVQICRLGVGRGLPGDLTIVDDSLTIDPPERPDAIAYVAAKTRHEMLLKLEAVGLDTDGKIELIDDLSYAPTSGWSTSYPPYFSGISDDDDRNLARESVFRWYRISMENADGNGKPEVPGYGLIENRFQVLPIEDEQVEVIEQEDGRRFNKPAQIFGTFYNGGYDFANTEEMTEYKEPFTIDKENGIVKFSDYLFRFDSTTNRTIAPATIYLRTAVSVRHAKKHFWLRYERIRRLSGTQYGTSPHVLRHDENGLTYIGNYDGTKLRSTDSNKGDIDKEADYYIAAALREFELNLPQEISYAGLKPISPDGAIQQVSWTIGGGQSPSTRASRNIEHSTSVPPYAGRRRQEKQNHAISFIPGNTPLMLRTSKKGK